MKGKFRQNIGIICFLFFILVIDVIGIAYETIDGYGLKRITGNAYNIMLISFILMSFARFYHFKNFTKFKLIENVIHSVIVFPLLFTGLVSFLDLLRLTNKNTPYAVVFTLSVFLVYHLATKRKNVEQK